MLRSVIPAIAALVPLSTQAGNLAVYANGEELATRGFHEPELTRDGWTIEFSRILANFGDVTAHRADPPFVADGPTIIGEALMIGGPFTADLVDAGDDGRVLLATVEAEAGHYNAVSWSLVPMSDGEFAGQSLVIEGIATRDGQEVAFTLTAADTAGHACGEFVGDERKGFVTDTADGEIEITLHLDHLFGGADKPADDAMNLDALGFDTFAAGGRHEISLAALHLGHAGEGHCFVTHH